MLEEYNVICYGMGRNFYSYIARLEQDINIKYFCDGNEAKWGCTPFCDGRVCVKPSEIRQIKNPYVIITIDTDSIVKEIGKQLEELHIPYKRVKDILGIVNYDVTGNIYNRNDEYMHRFIDLNLHGTTKCNFHCDYCYVWRSMGFQDSAILSEHSPEEIVNGLSRKRLGGPCYINICARGETLLTDKIEDLIYGLLKEGHYVSVVTNGTVSQKINKILEFPADLLSHMFFKLSFHYLELKKRNLFEKFWNNVNSIKNSCCSYTLEITPYDGLVEHIVDVKKMFEEYANGAMPHISFARDSTKSDYDVLSDYELPEYKKIWGQFDSKMFSLKSDWYGKKIKNYCYAGTWSYLVNVLTGDIKPCYRQDPIGNIYDSSMKEFPRVPIGYDCHMAYCFNNHAFLALGTVPDIKCYNYFDMRNRIDEYGNHWVKPPYATFIQKKLSDNNYVYHNCWDGFDKFFSCSDRPRIVMFNSPDYANIGDHAIALAEKYFFKEFFHQYDFFEISCEAYQKQKTDILNQIKADDIIIITGGGNIGSLWIRIYDAAMEIIQNLKNNKIFIFPQTVYFEDSEFGKRERKNFIKIINSNKSVHICLRDRKSYEELSNFKNIKYFPDMALSLDYFGQRKRDGVGICLRDDKEKINEIDVELLILLNQYNMPVEKFSTLAASSVHLNNREEVVKNMLDYIAGKKLVITDRLHCMIFCVITKTPCIAFGDLSGKIKGTYEWIKDIPIIKLVNGMDEVKNAINSVLENADVEYNYQTRIREKNVELANYIMDTVRKGE